MKNVIFRFNNFFCSGHFLIFYFWKNVSKLGNNSSKFRESVVKIRPQYDWISKIPSRGWQAWKTWFSTLMIFLDSVIFRYFFKISWIKKMTGAKKVIKVKNQFFHACQPLEGIFEIQSYWGRIFTTYTLNFEELFPSFGTFIQKLFSQIVSNG